MTSSTRDRDQLIYGSAKGDTLNGGSGNDRIYGNSGNDRIYAGDGNDYVEAGAGNDYVNGGDGNDWIDGGEGNDDLNGGDGNDVLFGGAGNDELDGGDGNDYLDGGSGINKLDGDHGNDVLVFRLADHAGEATGSKAAYSEFDGGCDIDTLRLVLTRDEWLRSGVQSDVARFLVYLAQNTGRNGEVSSCADFTFSAFNLKVEAIEKLVIVVDGLELDPRNEAVVARADAITATEDSASLSFNLLANDSVPDLVKSVTVGTAAHGTIVLTQNYADPANPIASVVYTPNATYYQYLAAGEKAYDSFTYTVTDADGDVSTATVTITILGQNDGPTIVSGRVAGAVTEDAAATLADTGTIMFQDLDLTDSHTVAVGAARTSVTGAIPAGLVPAGGFGALTARVVENTTDQNNQGQIVWSFAADNAQVQKLAAGQVATQVYTLTLTDKNGAIVTQDVTVTLTGTNDGPTLGTAVVTGATVEDGTVAAVGNIAFADVDLIDTHAVSSVAQGSGYRGTFTSTIDDVATGDGRGNVRWNFAVDNAAIQDLAQGQVLTQQYAVTVRDNNGASVTQIVTVTITGMNDAPVIGATSTTTGAVSEAGLVDGGNTAFAGMALATGRLTSTDVDQGATATWSGTRTGTYGSFAINAQTGAWTYTLDNGRTATQALKAGERVEERFLTTVTDDKGATATREVVVSVTGSNDGPVVSSNAAAATGSVREAGLIDGGNTADAGVARATGQLASTDVDRDASATWSGTAAGAYGSFAITATGAWTYTLDNGRAATDALAAGETRTETFTATVTDDRGATATQRVTVIVTGTNDAPVVTSTLADATGAVREAGVVNGGNTADAGTPSATGTLASTDVDHNATATWSGARTGTYGSFAIDPATGRWTYTLDNARAATQALGLGDTRTETFTATVTDDHGATAVQVVTITVTGTNDAPTVTSTAADALGAVREAGLVDGGNLADAGTPSATGRLTSADVDNGATATWSGSQNGTYGAFAIDPATGAWRYVLDNARAATNALKAGETHTETFTATVTDDHGATATQLVSVVVTGTNDAPVVVSTGADATGSVREAGVVNGSNTADAGTPSAAGRLASTDVDHDATATWSGNRDGAYGSFAIDPATGAWTYVLDNARAATQALAVGETRTETFTATVTDEHGATASQVVTITVTGTNDAPVAVADTDRAVEGSLPVTGSVATNDGDVDAGARLTYTLDRTVAGLTLAADGGYSFDPDNVAYDALARGERLTVIAHYTVIDQFGATSGATLTVELTGTNDAPYAVVDRADLREDTSVSGSVATNDGDVDHGAVLSWALTAPVDGLMLAADGSYTFDAGNAAYQSLAQGETLTVIAGYRVTDENRGFANGTLVIVITGTNDAPVVTSAATAALGTVVEAGNEDDGAVLAGTPSATGQLTSSDVDHFATATWSGSRDGTYGSFAITAAGAWSYSLDNTRAATQALAEGETFTETFLTTVTDDKGGTATQAVTVTVVGTNDVPVVTSALAAAQGNAVEAGVADGGNTPLAGNGASGHLTSSDVDHNATATWSGSAEGTYGSFAIGRDGAWTYTVGNGRDATEALAQGQTVVETFVATVTDDKGATATQTVTVTLTGTNDAPVATSTTDAATGTVTEAGNTDPGEMLPGTPTATGTLTASDVDAGATRRWSGSAGGSYGAFAIDPATGAWTYTLDNARAATQALAEGESATETFTATVTDEHGTTATQIVTVTVIGTNDSPVVTSTAAAASGSVTEAGNLDDGTIAPGVALATGALTSSDVDGGATASWSGSRDGTYGTFTVGTDGRWSYALDNARAATQALAEGQSATESFTATVTDDRGAIATQVVTIAITGTNDSPVVTGGGSGVFDKDAALLNNSRANAVSLDGLFALYADPQVDSAATVPHVTINGTANASGTQTDWYSFTVLQTGTVILDVDGPNGDRSAYDSWLTLFSSDGAQLAMNDDAGFDPGSPNGLDSFISITLAPGTYYVQLGRYPSAQPLPAGIGYELNVSVQYPQAGGITAGAVTEAGHLDTGAVVAGIATATGRLVSSDVDAGATATWSGSSSGSYGSFAIGSDGAWTYTLDNDRGATQALAAGQSASETFTASVVDDKGAVATQTITVVVTGTNDAPVLAAPIADQSVAEDTAWSYTVPNGSFTDVDNATLTWSATLSSGAPLPTWLSFNATTHVFSGTPPQDFNGVFDLRVTASDGSLSASDDFRLTVTAVDDLPALTVSGIAQTYVENAAAQAVDPTLRLVDVDGPNLNGAVASITGNYNAQQDVLSVTGQYGITGSWNATTGQLTLSGSATAAQYQEVLRSVTYRNTSDTPTTGDRTVTFGVTPTGGASQFFAANGHFYEFVSAPGIAWTDAKTAAEGRSLYGMQGYLATSTSAAENAFISTKLGQHAWGGATDSAVEGEWRWASGPEAGQLFFRGQYPTGTPVNGAYTNWNVPQPDNAGNEDWFEFTPDGGWNDLPNNAGTFVRGYIVEYGGMPGDRATALTGTAIVHVQAVNDAPVLAAPIADQSVAEDNAWSYTVPAGSFTDADNATLTWSATLSSGAPLPTWLSFNATTHVFSGTPPQDYNGVIDLRVTASDGSLSASDDFRLTVTAVDDAPVLTVSGGSPTYVENGAGVAVDAAVRLVDVDGPNLAGAVVSITGNFNAAQDRLAFASQYGITGSYDTTTGRLTLSGSATAAQYQEVLRTVTYANTSDAPTVGDRTINIAAITNGASSLYNPGNGHFYQYVSSGLIPWTTAKAAAEASTLFGMRGYLATVTSASENTFVISKLAGNAWLGGSDAEAEGVWKWVTGPEAGTTFYTGQWPTGTTVPGGFSFWQAGEPNNAGNEDYLQYFQNGWNDLPNGGVSGYIDGYLIEYGGMPGDPVLPLSGNVIVRVQAVNDAPVLAAAIADQSVAEDTAWSYQVPAGAFTDADSVLTYTATLAGGAALPSWLSFDAATRSFSGTPPLNYNGAIDVTVTASDGSLSANDTFRLTVTPVNDAPVLSAALVDQSGFVDAPFSYTVPTGSFTDVDSTLTYSARLAGGAALPSWLGFDAATRTFSGTPGLAQQGGIDVVVTASDGSLTATDTVRFTVNPNVLTGTSANETINGTARSETIIGNGGNDVLNGGGGDDTIYGDALGESGPSPQTPSALSAVAQSYLTQGNVLANGMGGANGFGENVLVRQDDSPSLAVDITSVFGAQGLNFFGTNYSTLYINNNGNLTFGAGLSAFTGTPIQTTGLPAPIIAAFWADVDTRNAAGQTSPGGNSTGKNLVEYDLDPANGVFSVTWNDVGPYDNGTTPNAFQLQLINRGSGNFDIVYRYEAINWTTGSASGNAAARIGYSSNNGTAYELPGISGNTAATLALETTVGNTGTQGLYVFQVRGGQVSTSSNDVIDGGAGHDTLIGGAGADIFVFHAGEANGDTILDFNGSGAAVGDSLKFFGYGAGATFTQIGNTNQWAIESADHSIHDVITFANNAPVDLTDFSFG